VFCLQIFFKIAGPEETKITVGMIIYRDSIVCLSKLGDTVQILFRKDIQAGASW
jgi:hypothetical protein